MNIINLYEKYFDNETKKIFELLSKSEYKIFLVGGLVRDIILNRKSLDIDITVEGNALDFAKTIPGKIISIHKDFGTVKIEINNKHIDLASTRTESYPKKGHLPVIKEIGCSLKNDILRRDFTVNALAMSLNKDNFGEIIDFTNGLEDINSKALKVLHNKSFIDDPSRILRGLKYASRLNFSLEENTQKLQNEYLENINYDMSYSRILGEFFRIEWSQDVFKDLISQKIYKLINPKAQQDYDFWINPKDAIIYFGLLKPDTHKFELSKKDIEIINFVNEFSDTSTSDFEIYKKFKNKPEQAVQILSILKIKSAKYYLENLKNINTEITGKDLIDLGLKPSQEFKKILDFLIEEKLKKPTLSKTDELNLVKKVFF